MKIYNYLISFVAVILLSCQPETVHPEYINLGMTSYSFSPEGGDIKIAVDANVDWTASTETDWIEVVAGENDVVLTAASNEGAPRDGEVIFMADGLESVILSVSQLSLEFSGSMNYLSDNEAMVYSPKGLRAIRIEMFRSEMGLPYYEIYLVDYENGTVTDLDDLEAKIFNTSDFVGVSDMGHILYQNTRDEIYQVIYNGEATDIEIPENYIGTTLTAISSDGRVVSGTAFKVLETYNITMPVRWVDGAFEELPLPETDLAGGEMKSGAFVAGMSDDGSVIWGYDNFNVNYSPVEGLVYWKNGELRYVGAETAQEVKYEKWGMETTGYNLVRKMANPGMGLKISPNGRYIIAEKNEVIVEDNQYIGDKVCPVLIDTETGEIVTFEDRMDMCAFAVTDEGLILGADPYHSVMEVTGAPCNGVIMDRTGAQTAITDYFSSEYGVVISDKMMMYRFFPERNMYEGLKLIGISMYGGEYKTFTIIPE